MGKEKMLARLGERVASAFIPLTGARFLAAFLTAAFPDRLLTTVPSSSSSSDSSRSGREVAFEELILVRFLLGFFAATAGGSTLIAEAESDTRRERRGAEVDAAVLVDSAGELVRPPAVYRQHAHSLATTPLTFDHFVAIWQERRGEVCPLKFALSAERN